jgi:hypothetical protein
VDGGEREKEKDKRERVNAVSTTSKYQQKMVHSVCARVCVYICVCVNIYVCVLGELELGIYIYLWLGKCQEASTFMPAARQFFVLCCQ